MEKLKRKIKNHLNIWLLISFILTVMVPLTGVQVHKLASTLFLILTVIHTLIYRKKLESKKYLLLGVVVVAFTSGLIGMILDQYTIILTLHKAISIISVFFLAIHIFVYHKKLCKGKDCEVQMSNVESKCEREKKTVALMIRLYCRKKHKTKKELCHECQELHDYAMQRSDKCPFMETKTFCYNCKVHCYKKDMREKDPWGDAIFRSENDTASSGDGSLPCDRKQ